MFDKQGIERQMFADFYRISEKYWEVSKDDEYWANVIRDTDEFARKYKSIPLAESIIVALVMYLDKKQEEV